MRISETPPPTGRTSPKLPNESRRTRILIRALACLSRSLRDILAALDHRTGPQGMDLPGFRLHALKGRLKGHFAVSVSANWRVTFRFEDGAPVDVDYVDYH